jgi:hypothetical protein
MLGDRGGARVVWGALASLAALMAGVGTAAAQGSVHGALKRPAIGEHTFLSSANVPDPFVRTYVRQSLGLAQAVDLQFPLGIVDGDTLALLEGNLSYAVLDFEYQQAVKNWLAMRGRFSLRSRIGTDGTSLLTAGVQLNTGFEFGWLIRLIQTNRVVLSAAADVSNRTFDVVDIGQFVRDVVARVPNAQLTDHIPAVRGNGGLRFGWGASRLFGFTALAQAGYGDAARRDRAGEFLYALGTTLDFNLGAVTPVPIGVGVSYDQTSAVQQVDAESDARTVSLRLGYTGRPDFMIGLDVLGSAVRDADITGTVKSVGALITIQYYF